MTVTKFLITATAATLAYFALLAAMTWWFISTPSQHDRAIVIKICRDGNRILRMGNGEFRALRPGAFKSFKVENPETVC
jgi:hypothetical protein